MQREFGHVIWRGGHVAAHGPAQEATPMIDLQTDMPSVYADFANASEAGYLGADMSRSSIVGAGQLDRNQTG
jgi:hypothetical protein